MKNTLITLASVATLAVTANAQTTSFTVDPTTYVPGTVVSMSDGNTFVINSSNSNPVPSTAPAVGTFKTLDAGGSGSITFSKPIETLTLLLGGFDSGDAMNNLNFAAFSVSEPTHTIAGNSVTGSDSAQTGSVTWNFATPQTTLTFDFPLNTLSHGWSITGGTTNQVPEPSSTALLGLGALGLIARRKR